MGLIYHDQVDIKNLQLQYLGTKISGHRQVYSLIRKLWDTYWYIWNYRNRTLNDNYGPTNTDILACTDTRINYHLLNGMTGSHRDAASYSKPISTPYFSAQYTNVSPGQLQHSLLVYSLNINPEKVHDFLIKTKFSSTSSTMTRLHTPQQIQTDTPVSRKQRPVPSHNNLRITIR